MAEVAFGSRAKRRAVIVVPALVVVGVAVGPTTATLTGTETMTRGSVRLGGDAPIQVRGEQIAPVRLRLRTPAEGRRSDRAILFFSRPGVLVSPQGPHRRLDLPTLRRGRGEPQEVLEVDRHRIGPLDLVGGQPGVVVCVREPRPEVDDHVERGSRARVIPLPAGDQPELVMTLLKPGSRSTARRAVSSAWAVLVSSSSSAAARPM